MDRKIVEIRLFEQSEQPGRTPDAIGQRYKTTIRTADLGTRMARVLRSRGYRTGEFDHLHVVLTPELDEGVVQGPQSTPMRQMKRYTVGFPTVPFNERSPVQQELDLLSLLADVLKKIALNDEQRHIVEDACQLLLEQGSEVEIDHLSKETRQYRVSVSYQIRPLGRKSTAILTYIDRLKDVTRKQIFQELNRYDDIYFLVASIAVKEGQIIIRPRTSELAAVHTRSYRTPIEIAICDLPIVKPSER
ncbi:hypothetical protein B9G55_06405 [Saccharibacillus sp. O16]|nr:hypothetical protein B9G55_06405 [Saccharibacillus sp. O16]